MNELTERLRTTGNWVVTKRVPFYPQENEEEFRTTPVCAEAADRIEELEAALLEQRARYSSPYVGASVAWQMDDIARRALEGER